MANELRGALAALFTCQDPEVLVEGRAGTAKTTGVCTKLLHRCHRFPGSRHLIVRETRSSLTESVIPTLERLIGESHPEVRRVKPTHRHSYELWGSTLVVAGLDSPTKLFSTEWDTIYAAEATEISLDAWELFGRAMRHNRCDYHQRIADCNPDAPNHWLNKRASPASDALRDSWETREAYDRLQRFNHHQRVERMRRLISVHPDNPGYWDLPAWTWTQQGRVFLSSLESMSGFNRQRMLSGRWTNASGSVYPEFTDSRHVIRPFRFPDSWPIYVGWDPGFDHPTAVLWFAVGENGCLYVVDEIYQGGMEVSEVCALIHKHNAGRTVRGYYADPQQAFRHTADSAKSIAEQAAECGIHLGPWPRSTNVDAMVNLVRGRLKRLDPLTKLPAPGLKVFKTCPNTIGEFQSWKYKRNAKGLPLSGDEQYEDRNNDAMDVVKGMCSMPLLTGGEGEDGAEKVEVYDANSGVDQDSLNEEFPWRKPHP